MRALLYSLLLIPLGLKAQEGLLINGMSFSYKVQNDSLIISLSAPTHGWIGIGFNNSDNIEGSDLLLFHVVDEKVEARDMFVKGFGDPREDTNLGGKYSLVDLKGEETKSLTSISFKIAMNSRDKYDFSHQIGKEFWLILAYSTHDDFGHHSRMRKHLPFRFQLK